MQAVLLGAEGNGHLSRDSPGYPWLTSVVGPHLPRWWLPGSRGGGFLPTALSITPGTLGSIDQDRMQLQSRAIKQVHNGGISPIRVREEIMR